MAIRWNGLVGKDRKYVEPKKLDAGITAEEVKSIVSKEVRASSIKRQVGQYFDDVTAQGIRTEALLGEAKQAIDKSLIKIEDLIEKDQNDSEQLTELNESIDKLIELSQNIELSVHKDNLISYKNIKTVLDTMETNNEKQFSRMRHLMVANVILTMATGILTLFVIYFFLLGVVF